MSGRIKVDDTAPLRLCDICEVPATEFCINCSQCFCEKCKGHHLKISSLQDHVFKPYVQKPPDVSPPSYEFVLYQEAANAQENQTKNNNVLTSYSHLDTHHLGYKYICIQCGVPVSNIQDAAHTKHMNMVIDIVDVNRSFKHLKTILPRLMDSPIGVKTTLMIAVRRMVEHDTRFIPHLDRDMVMDIAGSMVSSILIPALSSFSREEGILSLLLNANAVLRYLSDLCKQKGRLDLIKQFREYRELVNSVIETARLFVTKFNDGGNQCVCDCLCTLYNLSGDIIPESERKDCETESEQNHSGFASIFTKRDKKKKGKSQESCELPPQPSTVTEYEALWTQRSIELFVKILKEVTVNKTLYATLGLVGNMIQFEWSAAQNIRIWLRKLKALPCLVDFLSHEDPDIVCITRKVIQYIVFDDSNRLLLGKYALKQLKGLLPNEYTTDKASHDTVCCVLSTLVEILKDKNSDEYVAAFLRENGLSSIKYIKFTPAVYPKEVKQKASELLSVLWKSKHISGYNLTKTEVKAEYIL